METIKEDKIIFYDVDDTLVLWPENPKYNPEDTIEIPSVFPILGADNIFKLTPNHTVIEDLKSKKQENYFVIVWSQASWNHAEEIVKRLELEPFVDMIMNKPLWIVDDLDPKEVFNWKHPNELRDR